MQISSLRLAALFSRTPDPESRWFYPCEEILSHIPIPARGKGTKTKSRSSIRDVIVMLISHYHYASKHITDEVEETLNSLSVEKAVDPYNSEATFKPIVQPLK